MEAVFKSLYRRVTEGDEFRPILERALIYETAQRRELERQAKEAEARIDRLLDAVERGVNQERVSGRIVTLEAELGRIRSEIGHHLPEILPEESQIRRAFIEALRSIERSDVTAQRAMFDLLLAEIKLTPIPDRPRGETMRITLREEGWPNFWKMIAI